MSIHIINNQVDLVKKSLITLTYLFFILGGVSIVHAVSTNILIVNQDSANEGLNSTAAPFAGQTNNTGTDLGEQRRNVFQAAVDYWETRIFSSVTIRVGVNMDPLSCDASSAILGSAGPNMVFRDFPNAPLSNTWYVEAVANSLATSDLDGGSNDLGATFNSDIDNNNGCLSGVNWWLGINAPAPPGTISLFDTILHEIGHGIGVLSLVSSSGVKFDGRNDAYMYHLYDEATNTSWRNMSNAQRAASAINTNNLVWRGMNVDTCVGHLTTGETNSHVRMFAPNPYQSGSSVSHWDTSLTPDELMEPFATLTSNDISTRFLLKDVGWTLSGGTPGSSVGGISFSTSQFNVFEDNGPASIKLKRSGGCVGEVSVLASTSNISATGGGIDYQTVTNQQISWSDGDFSTKILQIPVIDDEMAELGGETLQVSLTNPTGSVSIDTPIATLKILDPDDGFLLSVIPSIVAASQNPQAPPAPPPPPPIVNPEWGVIISGVCDEEGPLVFRITQGSSTKTSTVANCTSAATFNGYVTSSPGSKSFSYLISSACCGDISGSFPFFLEEAKGYNHVLEFGSGSSLVITTYPFNLSSKIGASASTSSSSNLKITHKENLLERSPSIQINSSGITNSLKHLRSMKIE